MSPVATSSGAGGYTQANRAFALQTPLGADTLLLLGFSGEEGVSIPFRFSLDVLALAAVDVAAIVGKPAALVVRTGQRGTEVGRHVHGIVSKVTTLGRREGAFRYRLTLVPKLALQGLPSDCRVFQHKSVPDIVEQLLKDAGIADRRMQLARSYAARDYCVQYRESPLAFLSRLCEAEGIFYFFEHEADKHTVVFADDRSAVRPCPGLGTPRLSTGTAAAAGDVVTNMEAESGVVAGKVAVADYDYEPTPPRRVEASLVGEAVTGEVFEYPAGFQSRSDADRRAKLLLEEIETGAEVVRGGGTTRLMVPGFSFRVDEGAGPGDEMLLVRVRHIASNGEFRSAQREAAARPGSGGSSYANEWVAVPNARPYRPPRATPRPVMPGAQTAVVVGPAGEEIYVDKLGRVKVQFHWDRRGARNENSSCWVRVSSPWAGKTFGAIDTPRIGQEVVVDFLDGDPDRPIITGRVYNGDQMPPWQLPDNKTRSGIVTRSSLGGSAATANELRFEDRKGQEQLFMHAEKDMVVEVEHDARRSVGNDAFETVERDASHVVKRDQKVSVDRDATVAVTRDLAVSVNGKATVTVLGVISATGSDAMTLKSAKDMSASTDQTFNVEAGQKVVVKGTSEVMLQGPGGTITISASGIKIESKGVLELKGINTKIEASANMEVKGGAMAKVEAGAALQLSGGAMAELKAAMVKIN